MTLSVCVTTMQVLLEEKLPRAQAGKRTVLKPLWPRLKASHQYWHDQVHTNTGYTGDYAMFEILKASYQYWHNQVHTNTGYTGDYAMFEILKASHQYWHNQVHTNTGYTGDYAMFEILHTFLSTHARDKNTTA